VRSPLLDHRLIEFMASLPADLKLRGIRKKYILRKIAARIIPGKNINRVKQGFGVPVGQWFRGQLRPLLCDTLLSSRFLKNGYFRPGEIKQMAGLHLKGRKDYGFQLWALLMFALWRDKNEN